MIPTKTWQLVSKVVPIQDIIQCHIKINQSKETRSIMTAEPSRCQDWVSVKTSELDWNLTLRKYGYQEPSQKRSQIVRTLSSPMENSTEEIVCMWDIRTMQDHQTQNLLVARSRTCAGFTSPTAGSACASASTDTSWTEVLMWTVKIAKPKGHNSYWKSCPSTSLPHKRLCDKVTIMWQRH
jgi:hypothetical protein